MNKIHARNMAVFDNCVEYSNIPITDHNIQNFLIIFTVNFPHEIHTFNNHMYCNIKYMKKSFCPSLLNRMTKYKCNCPTVLSGHFPICRFVAF